MLEVILCLSNKTKNANLNSSVVANNECPGTQTLKHFYILFLFFNKHSAILLLAIRSFSGFRYCRKLVFFLERWVDFE